MLDIYVSVHVSDRIKFSFLFSHAYFIFECHFDYVWTFVANAILES